jgi:hypothetical protein
LLGLLVYLMVGAGVAAVDYTMGSAARKKQAIADEMNATQRKVEDAGDKVMGAGKDLLDGAKAGLRDGWTKWTK